MKRLRWVALLSVVLIFIFAASALSDEPTLHPVMHPDQATRQKWIDRYRQAPLARIEPRLSSQASAAGVVDLRSHLAWNSSNMSQRDQKYCGNCWVWSGTGVMEVALDVQTGIKDRLSEQFLNSCRMGDYACCGGWLYDLVNFYDPGATYGKGFSIPWSNSGANWQDGWRTCGSGSAARVCSAISTSPKYTVSSIAEVTISTQGVSNSTAINNIKNVLNQNKAVWFGFFMPTDADWTAFDSFWANQPESTVWTPNVCGQSWDSGGGGHAVLCVGYDDTDPNNRYWVMLNSWGANSNRPNGLFRVGMDLNYGCKDADNDYTFYFQTLDMTYAVDSSNHAPDVSSSPSPAYGATAVAPGVTLSWTGGDPDGDAVTYRVVLDTTINNPTTQICSGSATTCATGTLAPGTDYYWRVYATDEHGAATTGPVWHFRTVDAWNDDFDQALVIPRVPYAHTTDTTAASPHATRLISDDPSFTCGPYFSGQGSHSVWFRYTPAATGVITATTQGSNYDTVLAVWTGSRGALHMVTCNDDMDLSDRWSWVQMPASAGTTYYIEAADYYPASSSSAVGGTLNLVLVSELNQRVFVPVIMKDD